jgi:hypothetical protein
VVFGHDGGQSVAVGGLGMQDTTSKREIGGFGTRI